MRRTLLFLAVFVPSLHGQGTFEFTNYEFGQGIWVCDTFQGPGALGAGQLVYNGTPLSPLLEFFDVAGATQWAKAQLFTVDGAVPGTQGIIEVYVWEASYGSYESARQNGGFWGGPNLSDVWTFTTTFGGPNPSGGDPLPPGDSLDFRSVPDGFYTYCVPEPSAVALVGIGTAVVLCFRNFISWTKREG